MNIGRYVLLLLLRGSGWLCLGVAAGSFAGLDIVLYHE